MGGNAMAPFGARRHSKEEYQVVKDKVFNAVFKYCDMWNFAEIPYYSEKDSFGDMDILVSSEGITHAQSYETFRNVLGVKHFTMNGGVMSCMVDELQVDIIPMKPDEFPTALIYYSYNDLGNLMGKIFHKFGLKYGHRGLTLPIRNGDHQFDEIIVSRDPMKIFPFIGLDPMRFLQGFKNLEEIFEFVKGSRHFTPSIFAYENLNHTNRIRDRKRTTYHAFLESIKDLPETQTFLEDKSLYLPMICEAFPEVHTAYYEAERRLKQAQYIHQHLNGNLISEWTGLRGMLLGKFMHTLKYDLGEFKDWVMRYSQDELKGMIRRRARKFDEDRKMSTLDWGYAINEETRNA